MFGLGHSVPDAAREHALRGVALPECEYAPNATAWLELFVSTEITTPMKAVGAVTGRNGDRSQTHAHKPAKPPFVWFWRSWARA
jgi:hypothetical protein